MYKRDPKRVDRKMTYQEWEASVPETIKYGLYSRRS
jgi:hypothetical protein